MPRAVLGRAVQVDRHPRRRSLLATCAYIDLNPLAAGMVPAAGSRRGTRHCARGWSGAGSRGGYPTCRRPAQGSVAAARRLQGSERGLWLCPLEDRRAQGEARVGLLDGFSLGSYLLLIDATSRLVRPAKRAWGRKSRRCWTA